MRNLEIATIFNRVADLLEIQGANPFRVRAYRRAAANLEGLTDNIETLISAGSLVEIPGIGEDLAEKIREFVTTGKMSFFEELKNQVPLGLLKLVAVPSVGPKTAKQIYDRFQIQTIEELEDLCSSGKLLGVPGFKQKTIDNILRGITIAKRQRGHHLLGRAVPIARQICGFLQPLAERVDFAG